MKVAKPCGCAPPITFPDLVKNKLKARVSYALLKTILSFTLYTVFCSGLICRKRDELLCAEFTTFQDESEVRTVC